MSLRTIEIECQLNSSKTNRERVNEIKPSYTIGDVRQTKTEHLISSAATLYVSYIFFKNSLKRCVSINEVLLFKDSSNESAIKIMGYPHTHLQTHIHTHTNTQTHTHTVIHQNTSSMKKIFEP